MMNAIPSPQQSGLVEAGNVDASACYVLRHAPAAPWRFLDIGTRHGSLLDRLWQAGRTEVQGVDVDAGALEKGRRVYPHLSARLSHYNGQDLPFESGSFDVVGLFDVLEHIPEPLLFLGEIRRVLAPDGMLLFQTPNKWINIPKEILYTRSLTGWRRYHCSLQTLGSLRVLLTETGFESVAIEKGPAATEFNLRLARRHLGPAGPLLLRALEFLPLFLAPNLWGCAVSPE